MTVFVAVCDAQGFAAAARKLRLAPSAVTRLVAALEGELGVTLLQRTTRSISLTDAGDRFLARTRRILADLEEAEMSAQQERDMPRGLLTVSAPNLFGRLHVGPVIAKLLDRFPDVQAELSLTDRFLNLVEDGVDVAVRIGNLADSALIARRIGTTRRILVASPGYLSDRGLPAAPEDLSRHSVIAFHAGVQQRGWQFEHPLRGRISLAFNARFSTNSGEAAIERCLHGGGIAAVFDYQVGAAVAQGQLIEVLSDYALPPVPIQAVFPSARLPSMKVRAFLNLLEEHSAEWHAFGANIDRPSTQS